MNKNLNRYFAENESPCNDCHNRVGAQCKFYGENLGDESALIPCDACKNDCGDEST